MNPPLPHLKNHIPNRVDPPACSSLCHPARMVERSTWGSTRGIHVPFSLQTHNLPQEPYSFFVDPEISAQIFVC